MPSGRADLLNLLQRILADYPLWLGRSAKSSYGGAPIIRAGSLKFFNSEAETGNPCVKIDKGEFVVRLTSPALLRNDQSGQYDPWQFAAALETHFAGKATVVGVSLRPAVAEGFNRLWRTGIPPALCVGAGSVAIMRAANPIGANEIRDLQAQPIGERVAEGLGCWVAASIDNDLTLKEPFAAPSPPEPPSEPAATSLLIVMQRSLYRKRLKAALAEGARDAANRSSKLPAPSLLQRLRIPLRDVAGWRETYADWFGPDTNLRLRELAREPLTKAKIGRDTIWSYLERSANANWVAPIPDKYGGDMEKFRIVSAQHAATIWRDVLAELAPFYLDCLLRGLANLASRSGGTSQ